MKSLSPVLVLLLLVGHGVHGQSAQLVPTERTGSGIYQFSGILWNEVAQGSATVVRHPRIAASAAHVVYDDSAFARGSRWLGSNHFLAKHHSAENPALTGLAKPLRGFWNIGTYSGTVGGDFSGDLVVHYAYENLAAGGYARWISSDSTTRHPLNRSVQKILVGYSSTQNFFMSRTGPFTTPFRSVAGPYFWNPSVAVGRGMSGGGAFVSNPRGGGYVLGGVIVSGNPLPGQTGAGVRAFDSRANRLMANAIQSASATKAASLTVTGPGTPVAIPDNSSLWTVITLPVAGLPGKVEEVVVSLSIRHSWIEDLEVVLRSPSRRTRLLHNQRGFNVQDLSLEHVVASRSFRGTSSNGDWELLVRDLAIEDAGTIESVTLTVTGR